MLLLLFSTALFLFLFHELYWKRRNLPPGPTPIPFLGNAISLAKPHPGYECFRHWTKQYGDVFTFWLGSEPYVIVSSLEQIKETFVRDAETYVDKKRQVFQEHFRDGNYGIIETNGPFWREHRKFALANLKEFGLGKDLMQQKILMEVEETFKKFDAHLGEEQNVPKVFDKAVASVINQFVCGYRFDDGNEEEYHKLEELMEFQEKVFKQFKVIMQVFVPQLNRIMPGPTIEEIMKDFKIAFYSFFERQIEEHRQKIDFDSEENLDYAEAYLKEQRKREAEGDFESFNNKQLTNMCLDLWFAGLHTITKTLSWTISYVLNNPGVQEKMHEEMDRVIGSDRLVTTADKNSLPYMNAVLNESQRCANIVPLNVFHMTTRDTTIKGFAIPRGTGVIAQISTVMLDERVFPEPYTFNPERFVDADGKLRKVEELVPFSVGKRQCLGEGLARMELFLFLANFFNRYRVCPPTVPIFGSTWYFERDPVEFVKQGTRWVNEYSNCPDSAGLLTFWFGPVPVVGVNRGEVAKIILDSSVNITKSSQYDKLKEWIGDGLLISTNEKWRSRRKMLTQTFHFAVLKEYQKVFGAQGKVLVNVLKLRANNMYPFDIMPYVKRCTLDIICETAMGCSLGSQMGSSDEYVNSVKRLSELVWLYEKSPQYWLSPIWYLSGKGFEFDKHVKLTTDFTRNVIENRKIELKNKSIGQKVGQETETGTENQKPKKLAFLDFLITSQDDHQLSDEDIREEVDTFMFEGHDTTSSGITFTVWFLGQNPDYQRKVHEEMDEIFGEDYERVPDAEDYKRMVYLEQCIKETLRVTPPVPFVSRTLTEDVLVPHPTHNEVVLPAGLSTMINIVSIMKDPRYFERPFEFYPEHFNPERVNAREAFAYVPFSAGPRNCIGQKFALFEEKAVLSWIFRHFTVESQTRWPDDLPIPELILKPSNGTPIILKNRIKL
ncbi:unnamed protein product [Caenorhabditis sp. 36 PRJEB53466]|nr:unnamed protein product [Caenorhabditis sp. 36 PRJEB53466]